MYLTHTFLTIPRSTLIMQLSCSLEYWSEACSCYQSLVNFYVSESVPAEWDISESICLTSIASRWWRICLNHIEWIDEDMEEMVL